MFLSVCMVVLLARSWFLSHVIVFDLILDVGSVTGAFNASLSILELQEDTIPLDLKEGCYTLSHSSFTCHVTCYTRHTCLFSLHPTT